MNALEAVKFDETTEATVPTTQVETPDGVNRSLLARTLELCAQEHDIFMIRYKGLCETLTNNNSTDDQVRRDFLRKPDAKSILPLLKWLHEHRELVQGLKFFEEPPVLRFFAGRLNALNGWGEALAAAFELIDARLTKRGQGVSVGQFLLLAAINRATHPTSKTRFADWYQRTVLTRLIPASVGQLSSQAFWNNLSAITEADIQAMEDQLSQRLVERCALSLRMLVYDGTNFFTYINTTNPATLPARGHNKQKRTDLRQVNLGLLVSTDFHIPLLHKVYTGNINDVTEFKTITEELRVRYTQLARNCEHITLIFDKGNNSPEAFATLDEQTGFHFIGSLVPTQHADLLAIPRREFHRLAGERLQDCLAYRTRQVVFGQERTVLVTYNENLLAGQLQGIEATPGAAPPAGDSARRYSGARGGRQARRG